MIEFISILLHQTGLFFYFVINISSIADEVWLVLQVAHMEMINSVENGEGAVDVQLDGDDFDNLSICTTRSDASSIGTRADSDISQGGIHLRLSLTEQDMRQYVLTKVIYRLQDDLESQSSEYPHPLIQYLDDMGIFLNYVSRRKSSLLVKFTRKESLNKLKGLLQSSEFSSIVTDCLISDDLLSEVGILSLKLNVTARRNDLQKCADELNM